MAPVVENAGTLVARRYCEYVDAYGRCYTSSWSWWGRWVLAGAIVLLFFLTILFLARRNSRARRSRGQKPSYGTGFLAGPAPPYSQYPQGGDQTHTHGGPPPPQYVYPDNTGNKFNPNDGYYGAGSGSNSNNGYNNNYASSPYGGGQQSGIELQQPPNTYHRGGAADDYAPPEGPPPGKR